MITKIKAAEMQLDTAIRLFFENRDHISSYTLAAASRELTDDLCEKKSNEIFQREAERLGDAQEVRLSFREEFKLLIKPEYLREALVLSRRVPNFLKHADRDPHAELEELSIDELGYVILFAISNFLLLEQRWTSPMSIFFHWFGAAKPKLVKAGKANISTELMTKLRSEMSDPYSRQTFQVIYKSLIQQEIK